MNVRKPDHYCADAGFKLIRDADPEMMACRCTFARDAEERLREARWRAAVDVAHGWHLRLGGSLLLLDAAGAVCGVEVDDPPFESTLLRDAITQMSYIAEAYQSTYHVGPPWAGSTYSHFVHYVANTLNARMLGLTR